jgi:glycosyltransferase involved in cell wall biosynthesis
MISIITPVLNGVEYIERNIQEIMKLSIPYEHIIVDGGSDDGTIAIINKYTHLKLLNQKNKDGMYGAIHQGVSEANGKYLAYVNADDTIIPSGFVKMYEEIDHHKLDVVYSNAYLIYPENNSIKVFKGKLFGKFFLKQGIFPFIQPSAIFTKDIYFKVNGLRFNLFRICGDIDLFYRIAKIPESKFKFINVFSSNFYVYANSLGNTNSKLGEQERDLNSVPFPSFLDRVLFKLTTLL